MKLGLVVVLAVVALVPSLSEGRIVSRCELKEKLGEALPPRLQRIKDRLLAIIICQVNIKSGLDTNIVKIYGRRKTTTTAMPTTVVTTPSTPKTPMIPEVMSPEATSPEATSPEATSPKATSPEATSPEATSPETTSSEATSPQTASPAATGNVRKKREADNDYENSEESDESDENNVSNEDEVRDESDEDEVTLVDDMTSFENEEGDEDEMMLDDDMPDEYEDTDESDEDEMMMDDYITGNEDEESEGEDEEEEVDVDGERKKRYVQPWRRRKRSWSLGFYGLFQLSDKMFCDSGYRTTRNKCQTDCGAFTDDNIMDDIDCIVKTGYWRYFLRYRFRRRCYRIRNFFNECG